MTHQISQKAVAGAAAALLVAFVGSAPMISQAAPMPKMAHAKMAHAKMAAKQQTVYVCTKCREYWSPTAAKKMKYTDSMGHKMVKMAKAPKGYADGTKPGSM